MDKLDFKRSQPSFCAKQGRFDLSEVPESQYLMIDGQEGHVDGVIDTVRAKGSAPRLGEIRFDALREGTCVQALHISDVRRTASEKLRTILRQLVAQQDHRG